jgi:hypothetical protein
MMAVYPGYMQCYYIFSKIFITTINNTIHIKENIEPVYKVGTPLEYQFYSWKYKHVEVFCLALTLCSSKIEHFITVDLTTSNPYKCVDPKHRYHTIYRQI